ncbi:hypothetical protein ON010_g4739 [Phytophthora cinnamomi]|nr:hypothetical protein ON010_g4739 [Phytophthora cinnamomi]
MYTDNDLQSRQTQKAGRQSRAINNKGSPANHTQSVEFIFKPLASVLSVATTPAEPSQTCWPALRGVAGAAEAVQPAPREVVVAAEGARAAHRGLVAAAGGDTQYGAPDAAGRVAPVARVYKQRSTEDG